MGNWRLSLLVGASLCLSQPAFAQSADDEIEMEGEPAPTPPADQPADQPAPAPSDQSAQPAPIVKDPKVAKKWQQAGDQLVKKGDQLAKQKKEPEAKQLYENAVTAYQKAVEAGNDVGLNF